MIFPVGREKDALKELNSLPSRNKGNQTRYDTRDRYLDDHFIFCPKCKKQEVIEVAKPEENLIIEICLNLKCGYKIKRELNE